MRTDTTTEGRGEGDKQDESRHDKEIQGTVFESLNATCEN